MRLRRCGYWVPCFAFRRTLARDTTKELNRVRKRTRAVSVA
jgi:hypothetical protein